MPPGYDSGTVRGRAGGRGRRFPVLFDLVGFTGSGLAHLNWRPFDENVPERVARLVHERKMGPAIVVFADCFTSMGGNQYVNSAAIGNYADYLVAELIWPSEDAFQASSATPEMAETREHAKGCGTTFTVYTGDVAEV